MTNPTIIESAPDLLALEIMQAVRDGALTWQQEGKRELARDLLAAWIAY